VHDGVEAIKTPTGYIPKFEDLERLFNNVQNKKYTESEYIQQFTVRIPENLAKVERIKEIYQKRVLDAPNIVFQVLEEQRVRLEKAKAEHGDYISPTQD
jgi:phosphoenolpyruvate carboxykinase (GTP)